MSWFDSLLRPELAQIQAYRPAPHAQITLRLDANESPWPLPAEARRTLANALAEVELHRYPDVRATALRAAIAARVDCDPDDLVIGCGSDEVIALMLAALSRAPAGRERAAVLFPTPTFVMFRISALAAGLEPVGVPLDAQWDLDVAAMVEAIETHRPSVIFLASPNNPTAGCFSDERIAAIVEAAAGRSLVVLDEAYGAFSGRSYTSLRRAHPHVGQLQTLSKIGLAAARVGWAVLPAALAAQVDKVRQPYNLNALSQRAAELFLGELVGEIDAHVARVVAERERLARALRSRPGLEVAPSLANFLWLDVGRDAGAVAGALAREGILVRSFHTAGGRLAHRLRVTVGTPAENDRLLAALDRVATSP